MKDILARSSVESGTAWERVASYPRALRVGERIFVSGTTATDQDRVIGIDDAAAQTTFILDKIDAAMNKLGSSLRDAVMVRIFIKHTEDCESIFQIYGERFRTIKPASTAVQADMLGNDYLLEIELEAIVGAGDAL
jgi:enamine deaminase RidA (YjgF/YER057c/UK114 family)